MMIKEEQIIGNPVCKVQKPEGEVGLVRGPI
jgi:hypothetical protein